VHSNWRQESGRWRAVAITGFALLAGSSVPLSPRLNPDYGTYGPDKGLHAIGHLVLAAALVEAVDDQNPSARVALAAAFVSTVFGVSTELLQERVPGREFEVGDVVAGFLGSAVGAFGWLRL